ncbi:hypothetical protein evm_004823 [Chilo suppressalis]|nr:hypothetical protein evm_004823 [Chilo suppressalis]
MLSGLLRRAMCVGSRRGSSESYYRELGDQDTLKIEDKSSELSDESEEINHLLAMRAIPLCFLSTGYDYVLYIFAIMEQRCVPKARLTISGRIVKKSQDLYALAQYFRTNATQKPSKKERTPSLKAGIAFVILLVLQVFMGDGNHLPSGEPSARMPPIT